MWNRDCIINGKSSNSRGVAILLRHNFEYNIVSVFKDDSGILISLDINISGISVKNINLYAPNKDFPEFFVQVKEIIESNNRSYVMLCGDLNLVIDPSIDCDQYKHINNPKSRETIFEIMDAFNLTDTFRLFHPSLRRYSCRRKKLLNMHCIIKKETELEQ